MKNSTLLEMAINRENKKIKILNAIVFGAMHLFACCSSRGLSAHVMRLLVSHVFLGTCILM
jgi:hypothetical protein